MEAGGGRGKEGKGAEGSAGLARRPAGSSACAGGGPGCSPRPMRGARREKLGPIPRPSRPAVMRSGSFQKYFVQQHRNVRPDHVAGGRASEREREREREGRRASPRLRPRANSSELR